VRLYRQKKSRVWSFDVTIGGKRHRRSTEEKNKTRAERIAAREIAGIEANGDPLTRKPQTLRELSARFLEYVEASQRTAKTKQYYRSGWKLLESTKVAGMRIDWITGADIDLLRFPGGPSNANTALKTLRRMFRLAETWKAMRHAPGVALRVEQPRRMRLTAELEHQILVGASRCKWKPARRQRFCDVVQLMRDTGLRNERELYKLRIDNIDLANRLIFNPDSKTPEGRREVPILDRAGDILLRLTAGRTEGWLFPSKRGKEKRLTTLQKSFREARRAAGLPEDLVLYCGRHDYGTEAYRRTGNLALTMRVMGHRDVKTALRYQHPDVQDLRAAMNARDSRHTLRHTELGTTNEMLQ